MGELRLTKAARFAGREWTDDGALREERPLKQRADGHSRHVPIPPALAAILRAHLAASYGENPGGHRFRGARRRAAGHHLPARMGQSPRRRDEGPTHEKTMHAHRSMTE